MPEGLTTLRGLRYLNLSRNNLTRGSPEDIGNLAMLESLELSWNRPSGQIPPSFADLKFTNTRTMVCQEGCRQVVSCRHLPIHQYTATTKGYAVLLWENVQTQQHQRTVTQARMMVERHCGCIALSLLDLALDCGYPEASYFAVKCGDMRSINMLTARRRRLQRRR